MLTIAVDGYSSSGKGAVCSKLAEKLGIIHFDTGAIYRAIAIFVIQNDINPHDVTVVENALKIISVNVNHINSKQRTILNDIDITENLRTTIVTDVCSIISPYVKVRKFVTDIQRQAAGEHDLIMEGRDITSHVLPNADFKFFLDAHIDIRTQRRHADFVSKGEDISIEQVKLDLIERDRRDIHRDNCPLILTKGTIYIDNSYMTLEQEVDIMYKIIKGEK